MSSGALRVQDRVRFVPEIFRYDRVDLAKGAPATRLQPAHPETHRDIGKPMSLREWVTEPAPHCCNGELGTSSGPITHLVQQARDGPLVAVFNKEFVNPLPHRGFLGVRYEDVVLPAEPKGRRAATWPFRILDWHRSTYLVVDVITFLLPHGGR